MVHQEVVLSSSYSLSSSVIFTFNIITTVPFQCLAKLKMCLNNHLSSIIERRIPSKILKFCLEEKPWFNAECKLAYHEEQEAYHIRRCIRSEFLWQNFTQLRSRAPVVHERVERTYNEGVSFDFNLLQIRSKPRSIQII